jgi:hypothetical protein
MARGGGAGNPLAAYRRLGVNAQNINDVRAQLNRGQSTPKLSKAERLAQNEQAAAQRLEETRQAGALDVQREASRGGFMQTAEQARGQVGGQRIAGDTSVQVARENRAAVEAQARAKQATDILASVQATTEQQRKALANRDAADRDEAMALATKKNGTVDETTFKRLTEERRKQREAEDVMREYGIAPGERTRRSKDGQVIVFRNGQWVDAKTQQPVAQVS